MFTMDLASPYVNQAHHAMAAWELPLDPQGWNGWVGYGQGPSEAD